MTIFAFAIGFFLAFILVSGIRRRRPQRVATQSEFHIYLPKAELPSQNDLMADLAKSDVLGNAEMLLFSDIRLHVALVLREKNPALFRPDLIQGNAEPTAEILTGLAEAKALARVRFVSEKPTGDDRHLKLLPYLAYAIATRGGGSVVFDVTAECLMTLNDLKAKLKADRGLENPMSHARVVWSSLEEGAQAETRGLLRRGLPELKTLPVPSDQRILVVGVMEDAIRQLWTVSELPRFLQLNSYDDEFQLLFGPIVKSAAPVRILRGRTV